LKVLLITELGIGIFLFIKHSYSLQQVIGEPGGFAWETLLSMKKDEWSS
jgi:hypothetical protein